MITKLYEIEAGAKIYEEVNIGGKGFIEGSYLKFEKLDGAYSICQAYTPDGDMIMYGENLAIVHLSASTPLVAYQDGYRIASEEQVEQANATPKRSDTEHA